jgi:putative transposase
MAKIHWFCRKRQWQWPSKKQFRNWATREKFPNLNSQSVQEIIDEFCEAIKATRNKLAEAKAKGLKGFEKTIRYPDWDRKRRRGKRKRDVPYKNNQVRFRDGCIIFPNSASGDLRIQVPRWLAVEHFEWISPKSNRSIQVRLSVMRGDEVRLTGRFKEARVSYDKIRIVIETEGEDSAAAETVVGVDLGVNTLIAATDGERALLVSGRQVKSLIRYRNKKIAELDALISRCKNGSRRKKALVQRKWQIRNNTANRIADLVHRATRRVVDEFPGCRMAIGKPFNDAAAAKVVDGKKKRRTSRSNAQMVSSACTRKIINQFGYKAGEVSEVEEHYTSRTCPRCGHQYKQTGRVFKCPKCGLTGQRDVIGCVNIRSKALFGEIRAGTDLPKDIRYLRPIAERNKPR